jgi:hypothetical protein
MQLRTPSSELWDGPTLMSLSASTELKEIRIDDATGTADLTKIYLGMGGMDEDFLPKIKNGKLLQLSKIS